MDDDDWKNELRRMRGRVPLGTRRRQVLDEVLALIASDSGVGWAQTYVDERGQQHLLFVQKGEAL